MPRNPPFFSFASFFIVSLIPFINKPKYLRNLTIFITLISSFEIINVAVPNLNFSFEYLRHLADQPFAKALQIFETCVLVNNN